MVRDFAELHCRQVSLVFRNRAGSGWEFELIPSYNVPRRGPRRILREFEADGEEILGAGSWSRLLQIERDFLRFSGSDVFHGQLAALNCSSVFIQRPRPANKSQTGEVVLIVNADLAAGQIDSFDLDCCVRFLYLAETGMYGAIGQNKAVGAEVVIVGLVAEVAA